MPAASSKSTTFGRSDVPSTASSSSRGATGVAHGDRQLPHARRRRARTRPPGPRLPRRISGRSGPRGSNPTSRRRKRSNPGASVLWPCRRSPATTNVLTARSRRASSDSSSARSALSVLCGIVTLAPRNPRLTSPSAAARRSPGATGSGTYTQSMPSAANAALWIAGDRLCVDRPADHAGEMRAAADRRRRLSRGRHRRWPDARRR